MTDDLPEGEPRACPYCGRLIFVDEKTQTIHHATPPCPEALAEASSRGSEALGPVPFCSVCRCSDRELRPYGKRGKPICLPCMKSSPEREREAQRQMRRAMRRASGSGPVGLIPGVGYVKLEEATRRGLEPKAFIDGKTGKVTPIGGRGKA